MQKILVTQYNISPIKISLIYNGIKDNTNILTKKQMNEFKKDIFISRNEKLICFVGRLIKYKGVDVLIEAFKKILLHNPSVKLIIIGEGDFNHYLNLCKGYWNKIIFTGFLEKEMIYKFYQICHIGILPSLTEQCSYTVIEMMMHGLPIVGTNSPGINNMIKNADFKNAIRNDLDVEYHSNSLANCILDKLNKKKNFSSRKLYLNNYTLNSMGEKTKNIYNIILTTKL